MMHSQKVEDACQKVMKKLLGMSSEELRKVCGVESKARQALQTSHKTLSLPSQK